MRNRQPMNNGWLYKPDFTENDLLSSDGFEAVRLPHTNIELPYNGFDEKSYQFVSCYKKSFHLSQDLGHKEIVFVFEGVMNHSKIYFNGHYVMEHFGGYTPFEVNVTPYLNPSEENIITVVVDSTERTDTPPFGFVVDYLTYGGIYREVYMEYRSPVIIENVKIVTPEVSTQRSRYEIDVFTSALLDPSYLIKAEILLSGELVYTHTLPCHETTHFRVVDEFHNTKLWSIDDPTLYQLRVQLIQKDETMDEFTTKFGFRTADFRNDGFYLNGKPVKLRGLNRHQSFPYVGYAMPKNAQIKDAELLKYDLGLNCVRCSHYPQSKFFLDHCDAIGLLVFEELPGWQHIGDEVWQDNALKSIEEMIRRDWNHPSIIIWGVRINESKDSDNFYSNSNALAHRLDESRQTGGVRNFAGSKVFEDVYTYNDFVHRGNNISLEAPQKIAKRKMPYLVTEHNGHMFPVKKYDVEKRRIDQALRHAKVLDTMYETPEISGAIGWCMFDYNTHKDFGSGDKICYHGVMDMFRIPKYASAVYASQADVTPYMEVLSSMQIGDFEASELGNVLVFTNADFVKVYKNNHLLGTFYPSTNVLRHLPHPPVIVDDLIGDLLELNEVFSREDAKIIKRILLGVASHGPKLSLKDRLSMAKILLKYKMSFQDAAELYTRYIGNWGQASTEFKFEGYQNGEHLMTVIKSADASPTLKISPDSYHLVEEDTYDVTRIVISVNDQYGNPLPYQMPAVTIETTGPIEIIGPKTFALIGGSRAFWIKSTGEMGDAKISIEVEGFEKEDIQIKMEISSS